MDAEGCDHDRSCEHDEVQSRRKAEEPGRLTAERLRHLVVLAHRVVDEQPDDEPPFRFTGMRSRTSGRLPAVPEAPPAIVRADAPARMRDELGRLAPDRGRRT